MFSPWARDFIRIASVDSAVKWVPGWDNLEKGVQCYELFGGIALKNHTFSVRRDIAASGFHGLQRQLRRYRVATVNTTVDQGGLGLSSAVNVSLPAYAFSLSATRQLVCQILQDVFESCPTSVVDSVAELWTDLGREPICDGQEPIPTVLVISCPRCSIPLL